LRWLKRTSPFLSVGFVRNGLPGRGLFGFLGVEISTGTCGAGVPATVTSTFALVTEGLGLGETGEPDGIGVVLELLWHAAETTTATTASARSKRFGMGARSSTLPLAAPFHPFAQR